MRGQGKTQVLENPANGNLRAAPKKKFSILGNNVLSKSATRSIKNREFVDYDEHKKREKVFIDNALEELNKAAAEFAQTDEGWKEYLRFWASAPQYSLLNNYWSRAQLARKGVETSGKVVLSESAWRALGRRVKSDYAIPDKRRDKRFDYDAKRDWDDKYISEMFQPTGMTTFWKEKKDANGDPIIGKDGKPEREKVSFWKDGAPSYKTFFAYHQDATETLDGKDTPFDNSALEVPWKEAKGGEESAQILLEDLEKRVCLWENIKMSYNDGSSTIYDKKSKEILVGRNQPLVEQATGALQVLCQELEPDKKKTSSKTEEDKQREKAAVESAKYVISSLYNIDSKEQSFPFLAEISQEKDGLKKLNGEISRRTQNILNYLDPTLQAKLNNEKEVKSSSRQAKRKKQAKKNLLY